MNELLTLDEIVNNFLDSAEMPDAQYRRIFSIAIRGYRQMHFHASGQPQSVELEVLANKTSVLPQDYLQKINIGVFNQRGELSPLTEDTLLGLRKDTEVDRLEQRNFELLVDPQNDNWINSGLFYNNWGMWRQYGVGSQSDLGFYRIDPQNQVVVYNFHFRYPTVQLEYLPIVSEDNQYVVNPFFQEALISFIRWQNAIDSRRFNIGEREQYKTDYYNNLRVAKRAIKPFDPYEPINQYNRTTMLAPRS